MMLTISNSVLLAMLAAAAKTSSVYAAPMARIVGGNQADPGEYPYFVEMGDCGGALIAPDTVLFAAHCGNWKDLQLNIGAYKTKSLQDGAQERFCDVWIPDPKYGTEGSDINYDFALCKLNKPVTIDTSNVVLELNEVDSVPAAGENLDVMGLGALAQYQAGPEYVNEVTVPVVSNSDCNKRKAYNGDITDAMLCAGFPDTGGKDSCQGDSGGPIVQRIQRNGKNVHLHVGVVSWGIGCADVNKPGVYARTSKRADWIKSTVCGQFNSVASFCDNAPPPAPAPCGNDLVIKVTTDTSAYETEMTLKDSKSNQVLRRKYLISSHQNEHNLCLKANECYVWNIDDFDGISNGSYFLYLNGKEIASGNGNFSGNKKENFCTGDGVSTPVGTPTAAPVPSPTAAPVPSPTSAPVSSPITAPVPAPTAAPVPSPTAPQTDNPTIMGSNFGSEPSTIWNSQISSDWGSNVGSDIDYESTEPPTAFPTSSPTGFPTMNPTDFDFCRDSNQFFFRNNPDRTCEWAGKGNVARVTRKCNRKWHGIYVYDWCPETCGSRANLGTCA